MSRLIAVAVGLAAAAPAGAQTGLLVVAHGAGVEWNARVRETVAQVRWPHGPVAVAFLMGEEAAASGWDAAVDSLLGAAATSIVVVPLMVSSHGGHFREIVDYAGAQGSVGSEHHDVRHRPPAVPTRVTRALDGAPELGAVLLDRWKALDATDRGRAVVLLAHGPNDERDVASWIADLTTAAGALREAGLGRELRVALLR
ncbi:MAG: sirohydrochlorin chelatase, partial [Acidimicrobiales bacterium]